MIRRAIVAALALLCALVLAAAPARVASIAVARRAADGALGAAAEDLYAGAAADEGHVLAARQAKKTSTKRKATTKKVIKKTTTKKVVRKTTTKRKATTKKGSAAGKVTTKKIIRTTARKVAQTTAPPAPPPPVITTSPPAPPPPAPTTAAPPPATTAPPPPPPATTAPPPPPPTSTATRTRRVQVTQSYFPLGPTGTVAYCAPSSVSVSRGAVNTYDVVVNTPSAVNLDDFFVTMDADIQGANLLVVTLLHPTKPYVDLFKNANSQTCLTPRSERTFSDSAPQTSAANCAATTLKPVTNSLAAIKSGFGGLQLYRFVVSMPSPGGDPTQGNGTIYSLCMRAVYPAVTPPTPAAPTSQCLDLSAPDKGVIDKKDAEVRFPLTISGVPGAITSLIITLQFYSPDMRNIETYVYSASSDTKSSYPIPITNATVANCAASNPKWTFRDDGFYKYDACDNTDLYPASALAELRGFPVSDTWYISAIDSNKNFGTSIAKVNELCLYFNGATPA